MDHNIIDSFICIPPKLSKLNPAVRRAIEAKELDLDRKCGKLWVFTSEDKQQQLYLAANFCRNWDRLIVTIAIYNDAVSGFWLPMN